MRNRAEPTVPIVLWLCAAAVVHFASYRGADAVAAVSLDRLDLRDFVADVRGGLLPKAAMDVTFEELKETLPPAEEVVPPVETKDKSKPEKSKADDKPPTADETKKDKPKEPPKPPPPKIELPKLSPIAPPPPPPPPPPPDKRVAVQQNVEDKNQEDNPDAKHIGDDANHVTVETQAQLTNHEKNDKTTSPGAKKADSASTDPGNADKTAIRDADAHKGDDKHAPGEASTKDSAPAAKALGKAGAEARPAAGDPRLAEADKLGQGGKEGPKVTEQREPARAATEKPAPLAGATPPVPDTQKAPDGSYTVSPFRKPDDAPKAIASADTDAKAPPSQEQKKAYAIPKWGGGAGPNGINFNLTPGGAHAALGEASIKKEREADGERVRSAHRGKWKPSGLDRIHMQIENYVAVVKPGNTTALNTARVPFATYLNHIHNKLHPIFAEDFLPSLDNRGDKDPVNGELRTVMEVTLDPENGKLVTGKWGIVKQSGVTQFDIGALDAMERAAPFGKAPSAIISPDGFVHLHWEFHRRPEIACSTINARPFMMNGTPTTPTTPVLPGPRVPTDPREQGTPGGATPSREGTAPTKSASATEKSG